MIRRVININLNKIREKKNRCCHEQVWFLMWFVLRSVDWIHEYLVEKCKEMDDGKAACARSLTLPVDFGARLDRWPWTRWIWRSSSSPKASQKIRRKTWKCRESHNNMGLLEKTCRKNLVFGSWLKDYPDAKNQPHVQARKSLCLVTFHSLVIRSCLWCWVYYSKKPLSKGFSAIDIPEVCKSATLSMDWTFWFHDIISGRSTCESLVDPHMTINHYQWYLSREPDVHLW